MQIGGKRGIVEALDGDGYRSKEVMKKALAVVMLFGVGLAGGAKAQAIPLGSKAPAPFLLTPSGDSYKFLSEIYHEGADHPQDRRSTVALCFIGQDSEASTEVLQRFVTVAGKVQDHESLKRQVRFYVVGTDSLGRSDSLTGFLARRLGSMKTSMFMRSTRRVRCHRRTRKAKIAPKILGETEKRAMCLL